MSIVIFKEITTEEALKKLEADGEKYTGLYVDMEDKEQRKYVKENAALINGLLKKLDRSRIDKSKEFKATVEAEAKDIKERLEAANAPFSNLIAEHNEKRKLILNKQRKEEEAKALAIKIEEDHEIGLLMNSDFDRKAEESRIENERIQKEREAEIKEQAKADAEKAAQDKIDKANREAEQAAANERKRIADEKAEQERQEKARQEDLKHTKRINNEALDALVNAGLTIEQGKKALSAIARNQIPHVTINY